MAERLGTEDQTYLDSRGAGVDAVVPPVAPEPAPPVVPDPAAPAPVEPAATPVPAATPSTEEVQGLKNALAAERDRRRKADATATQERLERERLAGRVDEIARRVGQAAPTAEPAPAEPDVDADPVAALKALRTQVRENQAREAADRATATANQERQNAEAQRIQGLATRYRQSAEELRRDAPDFDQAYQHFVAVRDRALAAAGIADPMQRQQILMREELDIANIAVQAGASPAERIYATAQAFGYSRPDPAAPAAQPAPQPNGVPRMPTEAERLAALQRGTDASRSLGQNGGNAPPSNLSLDAMLKMSEDDFAKIPHAQFEKVMMGHYDKLPRQ